MGKAKSRKKKRSRSQTPRDVPVAGSAFDRVGILREKQHQKPERQRVQEAREVDALAQSRPWLEWLVPAVLCILLLGQLLLSVRQLSQTADESTHLYAGYRYWKCADFGFGSEHPPLAKLIAAVPLLSVSSPSEDCGPVHNEAFAALRWLYRLPNWGSMLFRARAAVSVFALGLCLLVWLAARQMFGFTAAALATAFLVFEPNILAHGALVTTDMVQTFAFLFAVYAYYLYMTRRSRWYLLLTGLATGVALAAKHSDILILPVLVILAIGDGLLHPGEQQPRWRSTLLNLCGVGLICVFAIGVLWMAYGFQFTANAGSQDDETYWTSGSVSDSVLLSTVDSLHVVPEAYLHGLQTAFGLAYQTSVTFIAGRMYAHGQWFYFPLQLVIKCTAAALALFVLGALGTGFLARAHMRELLFLLVPATVFLLACMHATSDAGIRRVLPILPLLLIFAAGVAFEWMRRLPWARYAVGALLVLHTASSLHAFPNYLSYANEFWGGPANVYKYSPSDWGQTFKQVKAYVEQHRSEPCFVVSYWLMDPDWYGVPCQGLGFPDLQTETIRELPARMAGTVFISSSAIPSTARRGHALFPFAQVEPQDRIGGSAMLVYRGDFDTHLGAALAELSKAMAEGRLLHAPEALAHARKSVALDSANPEAEGVLCMALVINHLTEEAGKTCNVAQSMLAKDKVNLGMLSYVQAALDQLR